jgi:rhodanese-related sulfurtransferase
MVHLMLRSWKRAACTVVARSTTSIAFVQRRRCVCNKFAHKDCTISSTMSNHRNACQKFVSSSLQMSTSSDSGKAPEIVHIGRAQMEEILDDYENGGREESQYCIIDVRTEEEVQATGKLGENVYTLPVQVIMQAKVFEMDPEAFEEFCQFSKPAMDETIVFSCAAGVRSVYACQFAAQAGYTKLINYAGGANEWFSYPH